MGGGGGTIAGILVVIDDVADTVVAVGLLRSKGKAISRRCLCTHSFSLFTTYLFARYYLLGPCTSVVDYLFVFFNLCCCVGGPVFSLLLLGLSILVCEYRSTRRWVLTLFSLFAGSEAEKIGLPNRDSKSRVVGCSCTIGSWYWAQFS